MYSMFGFLLVNFIMLVVIVSLLSVVQTYMQLCHQNYEWWWRSFAVGACGGIYMALYALWFLITQMKVGAFSNDAAFLIYVVLFIGCYCMAMGTVAVQASYLFVAKIYSGLRSE